MKPYDYAGKTVLITGASMGIGEVFARALARQGAIPVLVARSEEKLRVLAASFDRAHVVVADLSAPGAAQRVHDAVAAKGLVIDVLVNNAGFGLHGRFEEMPLGSQRGEIDLNVGALVELTYLFLPDLERRQGGVINVASVAGFMPIPFMAVYGATKAFVVSFSAALRAEYRGRGVRVLCLSPGATDTAFFGRAGEAASAGSPRVSPEGVVELALGAFRKDRGAVVHGARNGLLVALGRFLPRELTANLTASLTRPKPPAALRD